MCEWHFQLSMNRQELVFLYLWAYIAIRLKRTVLGPCHLGIAAGVVGILLLDKCRGSVRREPSL